MTLIRDFAQNIKSDGDLVITGDLQVTGTTTTLETATLNVEDKNITLNYSTGDSSATASGAGITIQDAINSSTDATILWNTTSNQFDFSNKVNVSGDAQVFNFYGQDMHVLNAAGTGWHEWGTRANDKIDLDIGGITVGGDILGTNFQLTGTTSNSNSLLRRILLASAPEQEHVAHPYLLNDLATFRPRGGTVNISGLNVGVTDSGITNMFRPNARFLTFNGSDYSGTEVTITLTDIPAALTYAAYFGMVFGAGAFKPQSAKIEVSTDGGSNWTVILNSSASDTHYHSYYSGNNNQVNAIRYTIGQPASTQIRIINLYAYNYSSLGMDGYFLPRDGGEIFGNIGLAETPSDFGTGYSLRIGNATKGGSLVLRSHDDGNSGLLQFVHKDGLSAMQLGSSTDTAPSPDEIYGYIYNYNNDFRIQGDNGTHLIIDGSGDATFAGTISANATLLSAVAPITFTSQGNTGTYNRSVIYGPQNNTSGNTANGIFIERGRLTDALGAEVRHLVIGSRGGEAQVTIDGVGNTTFAGSITTENLVFPNGGGIDFNAVQSTASGTTPSSAILDDYEEGTWTPEIVGDTASGTASYDAGLRNGRYQKVGRLVHLSFYIKGTFTATPTGLVKINGLPFSSPNENNYPSTSGAIGYPISGFEGMLYAYVQKNGSSIYFGVAPSGGTLAGATFGTHMSNSSFQIHLSLCYNSSA